MPKKATSLRSSQTSKALIPKKFVIPLFGGLLLVAGLIAALILGSLNQDNRQQAYVGTPTEPPTRYCHSTTGACYVISIPSTYSCPGNMAPGICPSTVTCGGWSQCKDGAVTCSNTYRQGIQSRSCSDGHSETQYCPLPYCPTSPSSPQPTPAGQASCNNSTTTIQNDCRYKSPGENCVKNGYQGLCKISTGADCTCQTSAIPAQKCVSVPGYQLGSCPGTYVGQSCTTDSKTAGTCVKANTLAQGTEPICNCVPTTVNPGKNEAKCSSLMSDQGNCAGQLAGSICGISTKTTGTCFISGSAYDSTGVKCSCMAGVAPVPTICVTGTDCIGKIVNGDCSVPNTNSTAGICIGGGTYGGVQKCTCTAKTAEVTSRCSFYGPYSGQCNGQLRGSTCTDGKDAGVVHSCVAASTRDAGTGLSDCTCSGAKPPGNN